MNKPFYELPLEILQDLGREPVAMVEELQKLQCQVEIAIALIKMGDLIPLSEQFRHDHASRHGPGAFVVGDYVIKRI